MGLKKVTTSYKVSPDGEVLDQNVDSTDIKWEYAEPFVGLYAENMEWRHSIKGCTALILFIDFAALLPFEENVICLTPAQRRDIIKSIGGEATFYRAVKALEDVGAIVSLGWRDPKTGKVHRSRGEYMLNPLMVWRGKSSERQKEMDKFLQRIQQGY